MNDVKMLSDDEIQNIFHTLPGGVDGFLREYGYLRFAEKTQLAFIAKQSEPDVIKARMYWDNGELKVWMFHNKTDHTRIEDWYGNEFEVKK